jgi:hypothetical protein
MAFARSADDALAFGAMRKPLFYAFAVVAALAVACQKTPTHPPAETDSPSEHGGGGISGGSSNPSTSADAAVDADAGFCTDLSDTGTTVDEDAIDDDVPAGAGGALVDGTYNLTGVTLFQGLSGAAPGQTGNSYVGQLRLTANAFERVLVYKDSAGATSETRVAGTIAVSGTSGTITLSCPTLEIEHVTYSVTDTTVTFTNIDTKDSFVFTLQP